MPFRLRKDARSWFRNLEKELGLDFDMYQLCLIAGLATRRKSASVLDDQTTVLVENFPGDYRSTGHLIIAFFLTVELESLGIQRSDRKALNATIHRLVDPSTLSNLSAEGMNAMNQYSYGGFDAVSEWFEHRPYTFAAFFPIFKNKVDDAMRSLAATPF